jgi:uncharacterized protein YrrD
MLRNAYEIIGYRLGAEDGEIGRIKDFLFDDEKWTVRYFVADTGTWLTERQVLLSPYAFKSLDETDKLLNLNLSKNQIEGSPSVETDKPVSREYEHDYYKYYGWPAYWAGPALWGLGAYPTATGLTGNWQKPKEEKSDPHLRSFREVRTYRLTARGEDLGHLHDFILDDADWAVRYLVVDTRTWWPGKKVLLAPAWIQMVSWKDARVYVDLPRETIKGAPEYDPSVPIMPHYEERLHNYYQHQAGWGERQPHPAAA